LDEGCGLPHYYPPILHPYNPIPKTEAVGWAYRHWMKAAAFLTIIL
jgi:hypothetical protein